MGAWNAWNLKADKFCGLENKVYRVKNIDSGSCGRKVQSGLFSKTLQSVGKELGLHFLLLRMG